MKIQKTVFGMLSASFIFAVASAGLAETATKTQLSNEQRQKMSERHKKMSEMHSKMSACLESEKKSPHDCRQEMLDTCNSDFGGNCPFMYGAHMKGMGGGMMQGSCLDWTLSPDANSDSTTKKQPKK
jgi:hypothetical protein